MTKLLNFLWLVLFSYLCFGQSNQNLIEINKTWNKFHEAFDTLDYTLMAEIHSKDLMRISGGKSIFDYDAYINNYKNRFRRNKETGISNTIELRFFERINNDDSASERGIYQLTVNKGKPDEQNYYGQFYVLFKKIDGEWLITMDYDSIEGASIGLKDFEKAYAMNDIDKFIKQG